MKGRFTRRECLLLILYGTAAEGQFTQGCRLFSGCGQNGETDIHLVSESNGLKVKLMF